MHLRDYQNRAIVSLRRAYTAGHRRIVLVSPTGSGKTVLGTSIVRSFMERNPTGQVAWFAHRRELVRQAFDTLARAGIEAGTPDNGYLTRRVQVVSVSGSVRRGEVPAAGLVVLDECHHFSADTWGLLPKSYPDETLILGLTATPERGDGRPLSHIFETIIAVCQPRELVDRGFLVPVEFLRPRKILKSGQIAQTPADAIIAGGLVGRKAIVFSPNVQQAGLFRDEFRAKGMTCEVVHGELPNARRDDAFRRFQQREVSTLINVAIATEGFDDPTIEVVVLARTVGSAGLFLQICGRGLRPAPGKTSMTLIDLAGQSHRWGSPLDDRTYLLDGDRGISSPNVGAVPSEIEGDSWEASKVTGDRLEKFSQIRKDDDAARGERLAKWIAQCRAKGHKWQSALFRYKGAYGHNPPADVVSYALARAEGKSWCVECKHSVCKCRERDAEVRRG